MDAHDLSTLLHMQNKTQRLLEKLQANQSRCHQLLDTSLSSVSSTSLDSYPEKNNKTLHDGQPGSSSKHLFHEGSQDRGSQQSRGALASKIQKQKLLSHLRARSKLSNYRKVVDGQAPGSNSGPRLKQGIENNRYLFGDNSVFDNILMEDSNSRNKHHESSSTAKGDNVVNTLADDELVDQDRANTSVTFQDELELLGSNNGSFSSTPKRTDKSVSETPRSILKHRKIINDNIRVDSEYAHTPIKLVTPRSKRGLNYSYSSIDDSITSPKLADNGNKSHINEALNGSYIDECLDTGKRTMDRTTEDMNTSLSGLDHLIKEKLLFDEGNDRRHATVVRDLSKRPKSYIFSSADEVDVSQRNQIENNTSIKSPSSQKPSPRHKSLQAKATKEASNTSVSSKLWRSRDKPLLGYDWIAGNLENESTLFDQPDEYFREIQEFRNKHRLACAGRSLSSRNLDLSRPISPEVTDPSHKCLHGYTLNERLFTEPINTDPDGKSMCPVCLSSREEPTQQSPGFVRVSIPRSSLDKPYKIKPHRRRSFDCTDSYALSQHCLAGYECSLPTTIPTAKNVDIRGANGIQGKQAMTLQEAEDFVKSHSRKSRLMSSHPSLIPSVNADHNRTTSSFISGLNLASDSLSRGADVSSRSTTKEQTTDCLLNISHNLRYDLQDLARRTGRDKHKIPHSTNYPVL